MSDRAGEERAWERLTRCRGREALTDRRSVRYNGVMAVRSQTREQHAAVVVDVRSILRRDMAKRQLSLGDIALALGYSERHVQRILREEDLKWDAFVREQRMNQAAEHLLNGQLVKSVAVKVGYRAQHLAKPFAQHTGLSPSMVRRLGRVRSQLVTLKMYPLRSADLAARCRAIDRWSRLYLEAQHLARLAAPDTPVARALGDALACAPPARPVPTPRSRRQRDLQREFQRATRIAS